MISCTFPYFLRNKDTFLDPASARIIWLSILAFICLNYTYLYLFVNPGYHEYLFSDTLALLTTQPSVYIIAGWYVLVYSLGQIQNNRQK